MNNLSMESRIPNKFTKSELNRIFSLHCRDLCLQDIENFYDIHSNEIDLDPPWNLPDAFVDIRTLIPLGQEESSIIMYIPLFIAIKRGAPEIVDWLLTKTDISTEKYMYLLQAAIYYKQETLVTQFLTERMVNDPHYVEVIIRLVIDGSCNSIDNIFEMIVNRYLDHFHFYIHNNSDITQILCSCTEKRFNTIIKNRGNTVPVADLSIVAPRAYLNLVIAMLEEYHCGNLALINAGHTFRRVFLNIGNPEHERSYSQRTLISIVFILFCESGLLCPKRYDLFEAEQILDTLQEVSMIIRQIFMEDIFNDRSWLPPKYQAGELLNKIFTLMLERYPEDSYFQRLYHLFGVDNVDVNYLRKHLPLIQQVEDNLYRIR